jgi:hypothetical protein
MRLHTPIAVLAAAIAAAAFAQDYPKLKAGQWELTINALKGVAGAPPTKSTMCIDDAIQRDMFTMGAGMSREMCTRNDFKREGSRFIVNSECKLGESKVVSRSVMTLTGDAAYHTEVNATYDPPFMGMKDSQTVLDGKYMGPCRDGLVPGDFIGPNGQKFNVKGMASGKAPMMPPPTQPSRPAKDPQ